MRYRPLTGDEEALFREYTRYAFNPQSPATPADERAGPRAVGDRRGLFAGADATRPLTVCAHHWFEADVRGRRLGTPGLSAVATPPEFRRRGHVRSLLAACLAEYRERGEHVSLLWPFRYAFYRRLGWEQAHRYVAYELEPAALQTVTDERAGRFHRVGADEFATLDAVYRAAAAGHDLAVGRDEAWWRHRIFDSWHGEPYVYRWEDDAGTARGYLVFRYDGDGRDRELVVVDHAAADARAYAQLWGFLGDHDSQVGTVTATEPADAPLLDHLGVHEGVTATLEGGAMVRLVDAPRTLEALAYPDAVEADLVVGVEDDLVDWHDAPLRLSVADGAAACEAVDARPDLTLDVATLSAIAVGARPVRTFADAGDIAGSAASIEALGRLFPPRPVHCHDFF